MGKKRVYEIAKDEGLPSANVLHRLQRGGMGVKTASSTVDVDWALHLLSPNRYPRPAGEMPVVEETPKRSRKKAEPEPEVVEDAPPAPTRPRPMRPRPRRRTPEAAPQPVAEATPAPAPEAPATPVVESA
ncbi:MAG: translation initiation factor IF-2 N-terminal domain-containing protein, partial [Thermoleophilia bacterium]|nr:translation initiation factor IF-2 N-terminal domain-containing protein [Thermoleophilia bacterium]